MAKKVKEKEAQGLPEWAGKDIDWEVEDVSTESDTKLEQDEGEGQPVIIKFFDFGANPESFKQYKPTAQELFNSHMKGIEASLWAEGLQPFQEVEPRLMFSKDKKHYRFIIACIPSPSKVFTGNTQTLSQIIHESSRSTN